MKLAALVAVLACASSVGARAPAAAPGSWAKAASPQPSNMPKSDLTFVLTADMATFKTETMLKLTGVAKAVPSFSGKRISSMPTGAFADSRPGSPMVSSDGLWLDGPQALLTGYDKAGNLSSVALNLQGVRFYNESGAIKFNVTVVPQQTASLKLRDGPVGEALKDSQQGSGPKLATAVQTNATWSAVTLVVESTRTAIKQVAETKTFGIYFGNGGWGNGGWNGYNNGWGNNGYYNNGGWGNGGWGGYNRGWGWGR